MGMKRKGVLNASIVLAATACIVFYAGAKKFDNTHYIPLAEPISKDLVIMGTENPSKFGMEKITNKEKEIVTLWLCWPNEPFTDHEDCEPISAVYKEGQLAEVLGREHWRIWDCNTENMEKPVSVVITNPAHTPIIPGCVTRKVDFVGIITRFIGKAWRGIGDIFNEAKPLEFPEKRGVPEEDHYARSEPWF
ncbi:MAG: hypothetical protein WC501_01680 [Candidatus Micrarchaeia archaeon]